MMATSPPGSPASGIQRPASAIARPKDPRSSSRLSMSGSKTVGGSAGFGGSRASDDDSRTAVKVAVRVRPDLNPSDPGYDLIPQRFQRSMVQTTSDTGLTIDSPQGRKLFVFDRVFGPDVMQDGIWDYLHDCVDAFTQGYNVSLVAYGQSGAGKSYTMGTSGPGEQQDAELMGVVPRAATALFEKLDSPGSNSSLPSKAANRSSMSHLRTPRAYNQQHTLGDRDWSLKATYVEIYNEQLRDLLVPDTTPLGERSAVAIREDTKGNILLTGLRTIDINSVDDLMAALNFGSTIRQTDATAINAKSSRSHAVFSLNLVQRKAKTETLSKAEKRFSVPLEAMSGQETVVTTDSKLHFVDLAGSERLKNTGAQGDRAKEGISINAGLASLGKVISQLSSRQSGSHVSYRDSKLTRLLQDSLGGNAITYMIACVTPAEFHLSETLNTVQYAQRARAIQSKPRIQQIEENDKTAVIERLKAEVAFLRDQIRSSAQRGNTSPRQVSGTGDRSERQNEREVELQNQLLDTQENYATLHQRHARIISEMARARETESVENQTNNEEHGETADERLNRSNTFAQAVEQVVMEYEKTIQSLEQSLSSTRGTLSNTETSLLERETRCAYAETINTGLQSRLQKLMDREASTENYLHDLESKLDGHTSGEEKNATIIMELRKEIARVRENEASCEDYISTLEERLAEADQDSELMQREMDRLEQVVERQRSLGKLDSLLHDLDHVQEAKPPEIDPKPLNGAVPPKRRSVAEHSREHSRTQSHVSRHSQLEDAIPEDDETLVHQPEIATVEEEEFEDAEEGAVREPEHQIADDVHPSPAQTRFVADKLENVTQELFDLRVEHESTVNDYDLLSSKYEQALQELAEMQDAAHEARHTSKRNNVRDSMASDSSATHTRPQSFLSETRSSHLKDGPRSLHSQSLSSELSSAMDSRATGATSSTYSNSEDETATTKPRTSSDDLRKTNSERELSAEVQRLKALGDERDAAGRELVERYMQLESEHNDTLDMVEDLKTEVSKARAVEATSPRLPSPVIRRKSSQQLQHIDRAHRSFAALRNIANDNFEGNEEILQNFELNVNAAMHELHTRSERVQELESALAASKKEMDTKMTIISGLTRERSSLKASPMDMSMVANLQDQLEKNEKQIQQLRDAHAIREQDLTAELESLRENLSHSSAENFSQLNGVNENEAKVIQLQSELAFWETKHKTALDQMENTEMEMKKTIDDLEGEIASVNAKLEASPTVQEASTDGAKDVDQNQEHLVSFLRSEIDEYKAIINSNATKVAELEQSHATAKTELEELTRNHEVVSDGAARHKDLITKLEEQIAAHEQATKSHQDGLVLLRENHTRELAEVRSTEQTGYQDQVEVLMTEHAEACNKLELRANEARVDLLSVATQVASALNLDVSVEKLTERIDTLIADQRTLAEQSKRAVEMESHVSELSVINETIMRDLESAKLALADMLAESSDKVPASVAEQVNVVRDKMSDLEFRSKKNSRLVEELEEQLQNNFDEAQMTNNRLSTLQTERHTQLEEALGARLRLQSDLEQIQQDYNTLQTKYDEATTHNGHINNVQRSDSNSTVRKSSSHVSLPSPPPSVPLPPLPGAASPPMASSPTFGRPASKDMVSVNISQITEDQEARIRTIEKHLYAERQLTQTLEEALTDLEKQSNKVKADCDGWKRRAYELEGENKELKERPAPQQEDNRWSVHAVEEERKKRQAAEAARRQLEERMKAIDKSKKKKGSLNCF